MLECAGSGGETALVFAFVDFLDDFRREGIQVGRLAAGYKPLIGYDLLIEPMAACVDDVGLDRLVRRRAVAFDDAGLDQKPWRMADGRDRFPR